MSGSSGGTQIQPLIQPQNPFVQLGQTINTVNALQDYQGKRATADAYGQAIDPTTGQLDQGRFNALLASTPQGRWNIGPNMQQSGTAQAAEGIGQQQQIQAKMQQLQGISGYMTPLFQQTLKGQPVSGQDVLAATQQAQDAGLATPQMVANIQKQVASLGPDGDATNLVRGAMFATGTGMEQLKALAPPVDMVNTGNQVVPVQTHPTGVGYVGTGTGSAIPAGLTPAQQATPIDIRMSDNTIRQILPANVPAFLQQNPGAYVVGGGAGATTAPPARTPGSTAPPPPPPGTTLRGSTDGAYRPRAPAATTATPPPDTSTATPPLSPPAATATTLPPTPTPPTPAPTPTAGVSAPAGYVTTVEGRAKASVDMANAMHAQASASPQRQALLADMDATNKQINTGPQADAATQWSAFVNRLPDNLSSLIPGMSRDQVASTEGFAKLAETFRQMQAAGIAGTLTNDKFASALASNPHLALSTLGNQGMIHLLEGSEDALQAKDQAWQAASGANKGLDYQTWESNYNKTFDPRVFWWARMTRPEQQRLASGMGEAQQQTLVTHLKQAEAAGLINRNSFNAGG